MPLKNKKNTKGKFMFTSDDLTSDVEHNIVIADGSSGEEIIVDTWSYAAFFYEKIQYKILSEELVYIDGIRLDKYFELFEKDVQFANIEAFIEDSVGYGLQIEMNDICDIHINWIALYSLCMYIKEIINRRLAVLFKPTIQDTINEITEGKNLKALSFKLENGYEHNTDSPLIMDVVLSALKECNDNTFYLHKIVKKVDVYTNEYGQIEFVRYISRFFHEYFSTVKRRKNSYLTVTEQKIICFLLHFFGFSPAVVQVSRFRQLMNSKFKPCDSFLSFSIPGVIESHVKYYVEFIPYNVWINGKINPLDECQIRKNNLPKKLSINMGDKPDFQELVRVMKGIL